MRRMSLLTLTSMFVLAGCTARSPPPPQAAAPPSAPPPGAAAQSGGTAAPAITNAMEMPTTKGSLRVISPKAGEKITTRDIPMRVAISGFKVSPEHVGQPDAPDEGHVHVMLDGENMGVLFNFYTTPSFTLLGEGMTPGRHTLVVDLASNTHMDFENTVQKVDIDYRPPKAEPLPKPLAHAGSPAVKVVSPADGAIVGPRFTVTVKPTNFKPSEGLEGKPNVQGYGHYHVMVDASMESMEMSGGGMAMPGGEKHMGGGEKHMPMAGGEKEMSGGSVEMAGGMMSMAGMVSMPGSNSFPVDLSGWKNGKHTITIEPVQNDHTPITGAKPAMFTINLTGAGKG